MTSLLLRSWRRLQRRGHDAVLASLRGSTVASADDTALYYDNEQQQQPLLSRLYGSILAAKRSREVAHAVRLTDTVPVISVGNFTFGATGKTPCVLMLTDLVLQHSRKHGYQQKVPMLLTRGYGDDEWRLFQTLFPQCIVAVGADRVAVGRTKALAVGIDTLNCVLLDDGLQQWRILKDLEIVMVDALHPFGNRQLLPLGSLRELPQDALARADIVIIHHAELLDSQAAVDALKHLLLSLAAPKTSTGTSSDPNKALPLVATSRMRVQRLTRVSDMSGGRVDTVASTDTCDDLENKTALIVCGVGNPSSVERVVQAMGCWRHVHIEAFPDHHAFSRGDIEDVKRTAAALIERQEGGSDSDSVVIVTTEKDYVRSKALLQELGMHCDVRVLQCTMELQDNAAQVQARVLALMR